jgi:hypothetical protein
VTGLPDLEAECFFIAPIGHEGSEERKRSDGVLEFIVARAAEELGLVAIRADQIAEPGQITVQVLDHVLRAKAAVADLTGLNPNVFYELAVRHTARLPVALIAEKGCDLPFDVGQMRTIFFDHKDLKSADDCRKEIVAHLRQALERGTSDSPIATTVDLVALQGGSAVERSVAELVTSVDELGRGHQALARLLERYLMHEGPPRGFGAARVALRELQVADHLLTQMDAQDPTVAELRAHISDALAPVEHLARTARRGLHRHDVGEPVEVSTMAAEATEVSQEEDATSGPTQDTQ